MRPPRLFAVLLLTSLAASRAYSQDFNLLHKNASAQINITNANAGVVGWSTDGVNSLNDQRFFYRIGNASEALVQSISSTPAVIFTQVPNVLSKLDVTYANATFSVQTLFVLTGSTAGSGKSGLSETITVKNLSGANLDFHLFQYSNFDLWGVPGGQTAQFSFDGIGQPYQVSQTDGSRTVTEIINGSSAPIGHYEASPAFATLTSLTDGAPTTLGDIASAGPGDMTFTYQWDVVLAPDQTLTISKLMNIVPEPSMATLIVAGFSVMLARRRTQKS